MMSIHDHIIHGRLLLPIIFIVLLMNFTVMIPVFQDQDMLQEARGLSEVSIDLEASFVQTPGSVKGKEQGAGEESSIEGSGVVFSRKEGALAKTYLGKVLSKIEQNKSYPVSEQAKGNYGIVKLYFVINAEGALEMLRLTRSSGYRALDRAAEEAIRDSSPFAPFPKGLDRKELAIAIDMEYILDGL